MSNPICEPNLFKHKLRSSANLALNFKLSSVLSRHDSVCNLEIVDQQSHFLVCDLHVTNELVHEMLELEFDVSIKQLTTSAIDQGKHISMLELHLCDLILSYSSELVILVFFLDLNFDVVHFIIITKGGNES